MASTGKHYEQGLFVSRFSFVQNSTSYLGKMCLALEPDPRFLSQVETTEKLTFSMHFHSMKATNERKSAV